MTKWLASLSGLVSDMGAPMTHHSQLCFMEGPQLKSKKAQIQKFFSNMMVGKQPKQAAMQKVTNYHSNVKFISFVTVDDTKVKQMKEMKGKTKGEAKQMIDMSIKHYEAVLKKHNGKMQYECVFGTDKKMSELMKKMAEQSGKKMDADQPLGFGIVVPNMFPVAALASKFSEQAGETLLGIRYFTKPEEVSK